MSQAVERIRQGYGDICRVRDSRSAYRDFHTLIEETKPDIDVLEELPVKDDWQASRVAKSAVRAVRYGKREIDKHKYFSSTGIMVAGNSEGKILAVDYRLTQFSRDPVAIEHGPYQYSAVRKLVFAALIARLRLTQVDDPANRYRLEESLLNDLGLAGNLPHYLGHAARMLSGQYFIATGASGMIPSSGTIDAFAKRHPSVMSKARE